MHVDFSTNVRAWAEGVVYGKVASEHKLPEALDQAPQTNSRIRNSGRGIQGVGVGKFGGLLDDRSQPSCSPGDI